MPPPSSRVLSSSSEAIDQYGFLNDLNGFSGNDVFLGYRVKGSLVESGRPGEAHNEFGETVVSFGRNS